MAKNNNNKHLIGACLLVVALVLSAPLVTDAAAKMSCGTVAQALAHCLDYFQAGNINAPVPGPCCAGIRDLNNKAKSSPDRQAVCQCLKSAANSLKNQNIGLAAAIPPKCGVDIPYKLDPTIDCSKVH